MGCRRWWQLGVLGLMVAACKDPGGGEDAPCQTNDDCADGLTCDNHQGGTNTCQPNHDHQPDCEIDPQACASTGAGSEGGSGSGGGSTGGSGGSGESSADSGSSDSGGGIACGEMSCGFAEVCVHDFTDPTCTNVEDPSAPCPEGQQMSMCGGAGIPCCCEPPPPVQYRCVSASTCPAMPACDCLGPICDGGRECIALGESPLDFGCQTPPAP